MSVAAALALAVTLSWPFSRGQGFLTVLSLVALVCLAFALPGYWVRGLAWGLALLAATFLVRLQLDPAAVSPWTPLAAGALLLTAELGYWSFELDGSSTIATEGLLARLAEVILLVVATAAAGELVLDLAEVLPVSGTWLLVLGVLAASGPPAIMLRLARR
jgi:hypothetical protein